MIHVSTAAALLCLLLGCAEAVGGDVSFRKSIAPILLSSCYGCHNQVAGEGGYRLGTYTALTQNGDSERLPIVPGQPDQSEFFRRLVTTDAEQRMPHEGDPLPETAITLIRQWIQQGAMYDAEDVGAPLITLLPITRHPDPPGTYRYRLPITAIAFAARGRQLLVGGYHEILVWDVDQQKLVKRFGQVGQRVYGIQLDAEQARIYVGSGTPGRLGEVRVLDAETGELLGVPVTTTDVVLDVAVDPQGAQLAAASADRRIHLVDLRVGSVTRSIRSHSDWVHAVDWSSDGGQLASASRDGTAKVFDVLSGRPTMTYSAHKASVIDVCFAASDATTLVSCDVNETINLWNPATGKKVGDVPAKVKTALRLLPGRDGVWLATAAGKVRQLSWDGQTELRVLREAAARTLSLALDTNAKRLAAGTFDGRVLIWDAQEGSLKADFVALPMEADRP